MRLKTDRLAGDETARVGAEGPRVAQADMAVDARCAGVLDGQRVDGGGKLVGDQLAGFGFGEIAQNHRIIEINRGGKQLVAQEVPHFWVKQFVTADEFVVFQQRPREEGNDGAVIGGALPGP